MRKVLIVLLLYIASTVTVNAIVTSENSILTIKDETLSSRDTSTPTSYWKSEDSDIEQGRYGSEGWSYYAEYSISNRIATLECSARGWGTGSEDPREYYLIAESGLRSTFSRIPLRQASGYVTYSNGLVGITTSNYLELRTSNNENSIRMLNVNNGTRYASSFSIINYPSLYCNKNDYSWYSRVSQHTSSVTSNLVPAPISITIPSIYIQNVNSSPGISIITTDIQATDLIATNMDIRVAGSANLSRVSFSFNLLQRHLVLQDFN